MWLRWASKARSCRCGPVLHAIICFRKAWRPSRRKGPSVRLRSTSSARRKCNGSGRRFPQASRRDQQVQRHFGSKRHAGRAPVRLDRRCRHQQRAQEGELPGGAGQRAARRPDQGMRAVHRQDPPHAGRGLRRQGVGRAFGPLIAGGPPIGRLPKSRSKQDHEPGRVFLERDRVLFLVNGASTCARAFWYWRNPRTYVAFRYPPPESAVPTGRRGC